MSIKTHEIHNSYLQDAPDSNGITRMVSEADYLSQFQQTDALQTSLNNIINAFGISGEGAHSKLVIEYVHGLVAENAALKESRRNLSEFIHEELDADYPLNMDIQTPAADAAIAEIKAQGVDEFTSSIGNKASVMSTSSIGYKLLKGIIFSGVDFAANLRAGRKG